VSPNNTRPLQTGCAIVSTRHVVHAERPGQHLRQQPRGRLEQRQGSKQSESPQPGRCAPDCPKMLLQLGRVGHGETGAIDNPQTRVSVPKVPRPPPCRGRQLPANRPSVGTLHGSRRGLDSKPPRQRNPMSVKCGRRCKPCCRARFATGTPQGCPGAERTIRHWCPTSAQMLCTSCGSSCCFQCSLIL